MSIFDSRYVRANKCITGNIHDDLRPQSLTWSQDGGRSHQVNMVLPALFIKLMREELRLLANVNRRSQVDAFCDDMGNADFNLSRWTAGMNSLMLTSYGAVWNVVSQSYHIRLRDEVILDKELHQVVDI